MERLPALRTRATHYIVLVMIIERWLGVDHAGGKGQKARPTEQAHCQCTIYSYHATKELVLSDAPSHESTSQRGGMQSNMAMQR
jgi:hypothetical protein